MLRWRQYLFSAQAFRDLRGAETGDAELVDPLHDLRSLLVYLPGLGSFEIPIRRICRQRLAGQSLAAKDVPHLLTGVLRVPFIEQVLHRHEIAQALCRVDIVHDGDVPNAQPVEVLFQKLPDDQTVSAKARVVLDDQRPDLPLLRKLHELHEGGAGKVDAGPAVVDEFADIVKMIFTSVPS